MTVRERLEKQLIFVRKNYKKEIEHAGTHITLGKTGITFYLDASCVANDPENSFFSFEFSDIELRHYRSGGYSMEVNDGSVVDLNGWFEALEKKLTEVKIIVLEGQKYALTPIEDECNDEDEDLPF